MSRDATEAQDPIEGSRMSFGEHLEELRQRIIKALLGLAVAVIFCWHFGDRIIAFLVTPYDVAMRRMGSPARLIQLNPSETFLEYFKISLKFGLVLAMPWVLLQIWKFVETGLYPSEQRLVRRFAPFSMALFIVGAGFLVTVVLTGLIQFLIGVATWFPMPDPNSGFSRFLRQDDRNPASAQASPGPVLSVPILDQDPASPVEGQIWINRDAGRLTAYWDGMTHTADLKRADASQFVEPFFSVTEYLAFVTNLALAFGLGFQIPIVVILVISLGLIDARGLAAARKYVILAVSVISALVTPSPDVGTMLMLAVPMVILFEIGLLIGRVMEKRRAAGGTAEGE